MFSGLTIRGDLIGPWVAVYGPFLKNPLRRSPWTPPKDTGWALGPPRIWPEGRPHGAVRIWPGGRPRKGTVAAIATAVAATAATIALAIGGGVGSRGA